MNVFTHFRGIIDTELAALSAAGDLPETLDTKNIAVEPPRDASHGDIATNAALVLSKQAKRKPRDIAELLAPRLEGLSDVDAVEIAGPGFIKPAPLHLLSGKIKF